MSKSRSPLGDASNPKERDIRELNAEFEAHIAHRIDDLVSEGMPLEEATREAHRDFGDSERIRTASLEVRDHARRKRARLTWADALFQDLAYAVRQLAHRPGFTFTALLTLVLGVGATVTIASVVQAVVFEPLPFAEPQRVVMLDMLTPDGDPFTVSEPVFYDLREETRSFAAMAAIHSVGATMQRPGQPRSIALSRVSWGFLETLGVEPFLGRSFFEEEDARAAPAPVAMLSYDAWRSEFGADPSVVGTTLQLDGETLEVVGVMPEALEVLTGPSPVFALLGTDPTLDGDDHYLQVVARLAPGVSVETAADEASAVHLRRTRATGTEVGWTTRLTDPRDTLIGETVERAGLILLAAAAVLLAMACANVANLLIVRATSRRSEIALRVAIGASRGRIARQLFTESALLAGVGGLLGILFSAAALPLVQALGSSRIPRLDNAQVDSSALLIGLTTVALATVVCGIAPALQLRGDRLGRSMAGSRRGTSDTQQHLRSVLAAAQVALTVVLLSGTGLLFRSFLALTSVDPGFEPEGTLAFAVSMPDQSWSWEERAVLMPQLTEALRSLPGVTAVGATAVEPFSGLALSNFVAPEDMLPDRASDFTPINWRPVTPGFFEAMGMQMLAGRDFREGDGWDNGSPIIIGRSLAERAWGDLDALDRILVWGDPEGSHLRVIGVVEDLRDVELGEDPPLIVYRPHQQIPWAAMTMVLRHEGEASGIASAIRPSLAGVLPTLPVGDIESLEGHLNRAVAEPRFNLQILAAFALAGLMLALVGLWGVTAFDVRRRFPEIGVRLSLGARPESVLRMVVRSRLAVTFVGIAVGIFLARLAAGAMSSLLYEIEPNDPLTWTGVVVIVVATSLLATWLPARAALSVNPRDVLNAS